MDLNHLNIIAPYMDCVTHISASVYYAFCVTVFVNTAFKKNVLTIKFCFSVSQEYCSWEKFNATCQHDEVILMRSARYWYRLPINLATLNVAVINDMPLWHLMSIQKIYMHISFDIYVDCKAGKWTIHHKSHQVLLNYFVSVSS